MLHSRTVPSVAADHCSDAGRNSGGRQIKKTCATVLKNIQSKSCFIIHFKNLSNTNSKGELKLKKAILTWVASKSL